ncbi:MAG: metallophosphoesterase N-terminal domain-containing protein [bacterium]
MLTILALAASTVIGSGTVYLDRNANGKRDAGEPGLPGVVVSDQVNVVRTGADGQFTLANSAGTALVFVSVPSGYRLTGSFWRNTADGAAEFGLAPAPVPAQFSFVHASDTHISAASVNRTARFRALVDSIRPSFVLLTGDLVRDALRVGEAEATGYYELFQTQATQFTVPLWTVPGNHENFGIERTKSGVSATHPLYGRAMYHHYRGPDYYSFNFGGIHFVGLNSVDIDDQSYYGHVDSTQVEWLKRDLAMIAPTMPVVTFNHIPFFTAVESINGFMDGPPAPSTITIGGKTNFRHTVSNAKDILAIIGLPRLPMALGGHMHVREQLRYDGVPTRFNQTAAVVGPSGEGALRFPSGITVYRVRAGKIDDGTFVRIADVP